MVPVYPIGDPDAIARAVRALRGGEIIAFPTDTLYGVGGDALSAAAVRRVAEAKRRDASKAMPVLLASADAVPGVAAEWPQLAERLAAAFWPGALTIVVPALGHVPDGVRSNGTVALRVPGLASLRELIASAGHPLIGTSANLSGEPAALTAGEARRALGDHVALVLDGGRVGGAPSTVVAVAGDRLRVLREGAVSRAELDAVSQE